MIQAVAFPEKSTNALMAPAILKYRGFRSISAFPLNAFALPLKSSRKACPVNVSELSFVSSGTSTARVSPEIGTPVRKAASLTNRIRAKSSSIAIIVKEREGAEEMKHAADAMDQSTTALAQNKKTSDTASQQKAALDALEKTSSQLLTGP